QSGPGFHRVAAHQYRHALLLVVDTHTAVQFAGDLARAEPPLRAARLPADDDDSVRIVWRRTHLPQRVVTTDDRHSARSEALQRPRLAIVARDDDISVDGPRSCAHRLRIALPADLIGCSRIDPREPTRPESLHRQQGQSGDCTADRIDTEKAD